MKNMSSSSTPSLARTFKEKHVDSIPDGSHEDVGPIGCIVFTEAARKEAREWFKKVRQPSQKNHYLPFKPYTLLNSSREKVLDYNREIGHTITTPAQLRSPSNRE